MSQNPWADPTSMIRLRVSPGLAEANIVLVGLGQWSSPITWPISWVKVFCRSVETQFSVGGDDSGQTGESTEVNRYDVPPPAGAAPFSSMSASRMMPVLVL